MRVRLWFTARAASLVFLGCTVSLAASLAEGSAGHMALAERPSSWSETSEIIFQFNAKPPETSYRDQYLYQEILKKLLAAIAFELPPADFCTRRVEDDISGQSSFGEFMIRIAHPNPDRRVRCLRAAIDDLLRQPIKEFDFSLACRRLAESQRFWDRLESAHSFDQSRATGRALRIIYRRGTPLYQLHAVDASDFDAVMFDDFVEWLRRNRERNLISFYGSPKILELVGLPVPDPMVLTIQISLDSPEFPRECCSSTMKALVLRASLS